MPITFPVSPAPIAPPERQPCSWAIALSAGNTYRRVNAAVLQRTHHDPGDLWVPADSVAVIDGLLAYPANPNGGPDTATVVSCGSEVVDAAIRYGDLDPAEVNSRLRELGIIVREVVQQISGGRHGPFSRSRSQRMPLLPCDGSARHRSG